MEMNKKINKDEKQEDIVIIDEGINVKHVIEPLSFVCCPILIIPFKII